MPISEPAAASRRVSARSSAEGSGSPEGWLWKRTSAAALVLFHNHPSGDPEPSAEDLALTRRLAAAGSLMGIEVLDHLVLGAGRYVSLKDRGVL